MEMLLTRPRPSSFAIPCKRKPHQNPSVVSLRRITASASTASSLTAQEAAVNRVNVISESLPYIQKFHGKTVVVKYGGAAMKSPEFREFVAKDLALLSCVGMRMVLVHGGGPEINSWLAKINVEPKFLNGLRVTDELTMEVVEMVLVGKVNKSLVSLINQQGATAVGLCGKDARLITAHPSPNAVALGFVGEVSNVNPSILYPILSDGHIPVIASVAADKFGQAYNINADTAAGEIAAAVGAEKLILLTDVAGILEDRNDPSSLIKEIDISGIQKMTEEGKVAGGMIPKVECCIKSLTKGVSTASIIDGRVPHSLLLELLTDEGEIMKNPCIAADGFTYEAEAIKTWLNRRHNTSPMTNLVFPHHDLIPNHVLCSAIEEWLQQHSESH